MMGDLIVWLSIVFAVAFAAAWLIRPDLRAWLERPKYRFQAHVQDYDRVQREQADTARRRPRD